METERGWDGCGGEVWLPDNFLIVQVDLRGLGQLLRARAVAHLLVQELFGCVQLRLQQKSNYKNKSVTSNKT